MLLIGNGTVITRDPVNPLIENGGVLIEGDSIVAVGKMADLNHENSGCRLLDAGGQLIMPGMINAHMHFYSTFARGMSLKDDPPQNFVEILQRLWWRLDRVLSLEDVYYLSLIHI
ncbi:MAG: chlorohydrolase, partial [Negativicutes bacterium]|nr:chlorohydrolase [Negativicutes bacterium]